MNSSPKSHTKASSDNVQAIRPPGQFMEPAAGWQQKTKFGFMGCDSTPAGRLVRLADVLRWLGEHPRPLPHQVALDELCNAMPADVMQWLYQAQGSASPYAKQVPVDCMFGYQTAEQIKAAKANAIQDKLQRDFEEEQGGCGAVWRIGAGNIATAQPQPTEPGLPALVRKIKEAWASEQFRGLPTIDRLKPVGSINYLAIPFDKAAQHWGWGRVVNAPSDTTQGEATAEQGEAATEWTGKRLAAQQALFKTDGLGKHTQRLATLSGIGEREIRRRIKQDQDAQPSGKAVSTVFDMGKRTALKARPVS